MAPFSDDKAAPPLPAPFIDAASACSGEEPELAAEDPAPTSLGPAEALDMALQVPRCWWPAGSLGRAATCRTAGSSALERAEVAVDDSKTYHLPMSHAAYYATPAVLVHVQEARKLQTARQLERQVFAATHGITAGD